MVSIDSETLFNGAAAVVATIAVLFFILNVEFGYSPVSKVLLVVLFLTGIFVITQVTTDSQLTLLGYGVIVTAVVALFFDVVNVFNVGNTLTVFGLLVIAAVLFGLRSRLDEDNHFTSGSRAKAALGAVAVLTVAVLVTDVVTGGLAYELQSQSQVEIPEEERNEIRVATLVVSNPTPLPERIETPEYAVCTAGNWSAYRWSESSERRPHEADVHISIRGGYDEYVTSFGTRRFPVHLHIDGANVSGETFRIQTTERCPDDDTGSPYIALYRAPENRPGVRPV